MKFYFFTILLTLFIFSSSFAQSKLPEGYFVSEANSIATGNEILLSVKKYNPTQSEIDNAGQPAGNKPMNYMMIPFEYTKISMYGKSFESKLYSLNNEGHVLWDMTLGYSENTLASPIKFYSGFIYTGGSAKDADKIMINKIDPNGKIVWQTELDSLHNLNDIYVEGNLVSALVSFNTSKQINNKDGSFSEKVYPIYFFVQLDISTGKLLKKEYQMMANYLSSLNFSNPFLNTPESYFLNNKDSAIFLNSIKQESGTVVTQNMSKENSILELIAGNESYHLLTQLNDGKNKNVYNVISDFYGKNKKYQMKLPFEYNSSDRRFIYKTKGDSILTVVGNKNNITIGYIDIEGKYSLYKKIVDQTLPIMSAGIVADKVYILQMQGRNKPGEIGRITIKW